MLYERILSIESDNNPIEMVDIVVRGITTVGTDVSRR